MNLASDALSKFDGSTVPATPPGQQQQSPPAHQPPVAEAHPSPPAPTETASVPPESAAAAVPAPVIPFTEPTRALETPPEGDGLGDPATTAARQGRERTNAQHPETSEGSIPLMGIEYVKSKNIIQVIPYEKTGSLPKASGDQLRVLCRVGHQPLCTR
jgi:hypothetical protein